MEIFRRYVSGTEVLIDNSFKRGEKTTELRVSKYFDDGTAVYVNLNEGETMSLYHTLKKIYEEE